MKIIALKWRVHKAMLVALFGTCVVSVGSTSQELEPTRIVYWNLMGGNVGPQRDSAIRSVLAFLKPDLLVAQHLFSDSDTSVVSAGFRAGSGGGHENIFYSDLDRTYFISSRDRYEWITTFNRFREGRQQLGVAVREIRGVAFSIFAASWLPEWAGGDGLSHRSDADDLLLMAQISERDLQCQGRVIMVGAFNASSSADSGLRYLRQTTWLTSPLVDISEREGRWDSNEAYSQLHTASASDGLTTRPTMAMVSQALLPSIVHWSILGNDGDHYGRGVSDGGNSTVSPENARLLEIASSSLPIVVDVEFATSSAGEDSKQSDTLDLE